MAQDIYLSEGKLIGPEGHVDISTLAGNGTTAFNIDVLGAAYSTVGLSTVTFNAGYWNNGARLSDTPAQNDEAVFGLPAVPQGGTYSLALLARIGPDRGIAHIAMSPDASTWTDLTTIDCYAGANTTAARLTATGVQVPAGMKFIRIKVATKNASSSAYGMQLQGLSGVRTGDFT